MPSFSALCFFSQAALSAQGTHCIALRERSSGQVCSLTSFACIQYHIYLLFTASMSCWCAGDEVTAAKVKLILSTNGNITRFGWVRGDGIFSIPGVTAGSHLLEVSAINMIYPQVCLQTHDEVHRVMVL